MPELHLTDVQRLREVYTLAGDERYLGSARCNACCPVAVLMRRHRRFPAYTFVEFTRCGNIDYRHSRGMRLLVRLIDGHPRGTPIGGVLLDGWLNDLFDSGFDKFDGIGYSDGFGGDES